MKSRNLTFKALIIITTTLLITPTAVILGDNFTNGINATQSEDNLHRLQINLETSPAPIKSLGSTFFNIKTALGNVIELNCVRFEYLKTYKFWALLYDERYIFILRQ